MSRHIPLRSAEPASGDQPRQVATAGDELWVSVFGGNFVAEVNPRSGQVIARVRVCTGPHGLAFAAGALWIGCTVSGELVDVDPNSRKVVRRVPYTAADAVTRTGSMLLVTSDTGPSTAVLDPASGKLSQKLQLSNGFIVDANADVARAGNSTWVSSPDEGALYRVQPSG